MHRFLRRIWYTCLMACLVLVPLSAHAAVFAEYETATGESAYHNNTTVNSRRTDHFLMRFGNQPRDGFMQEHVFEGHLQFLEHVYDQWQLLGLHDMGGIQSTKYKGVLKPHSTWDWDPAGTAVGFQEGGSTYAIPALHVPCNAVNYMAGNGCTPHEFGHGWQNQHLDSTTGGLPACTPQGFTESLANWVMSLYLGDYPAEWPAVGCTYGHAINGYNCMAIFQYFFEAPGYGANFVNKLIFDPNLNSSANYNGDDIIQKAIRCDTSGAVDHAGAIRDGLGMMNAKMLDMDFWNKRFDRTYAYTVDTAWSGYQWNRIPMVKQPGVTGWYRPEWLCTPQQASNSYIPLTITASGSPRVVTCEFRPVSDAVRGTVFRACFVAFNANKEPRYSKVWDAGENSFALADDENTVYLAVYAVPKIWNTQFMSNDYVMDNVAMMPYRVKFTGATPKGWTWPTPAAGTYHNHTNGGGIVANTATVDATAYVGPNAMVLGTAKVYGNSRIDDYACVDSSATIGRSGQSDNPVICCHAYVTGSAQVYGHAKVTDYAWIWGTSQVYDNALVMAHTMMSAGSAFGNAVLNQCPMNRTGMALNGTFSGSVIRGGDNSGGGTYTYGVYQDWKNSYTSDNKYQYIGHNFEKKSAIFAMDQYGSNHGFLMGEPQVVSDTVNGVTTNVLSLNGSSQYVELKPEAVNFPDVSVTAWVKWTGSANDQRIFSFGDGSTKYMYLTPKDTTTGKLRFVISNGSTTQYLDGAAALTANTWTHVAVTITGTTGVLYVNGTAVDTDAAISIDPDQLNAPMMENANYLGRGNSGNYFQGSVDEFDIYNKALSSAEVTTAMGTVAAGVAPASDTAAPTPNAATWLVQPTVVGDGAISMVATEGTDAGGNGVLYYFTCVTDSTHDSGWISEPKFTDCKCAAGTTYNYTVKMKDKLGNTGTASSQAGATMTAADTTAPTPNPPTFSSAPKGDSATSITMTATKATDNDETVLYKFSRVGGTQTSGWTSSRIWTDTGLTSGNSYSYTLQVKDSHGNTTSTTTSAAALARDDTAPALDSARKLQWDMEPYVRLDKTVRMIVKKPVEWDVEYYFECVENTSINSGWIANAGQNSYTPWVTPAMADGTWTFHYKMRDKSPQQNQSGWSATSQVKILASNCYHDYSLTQLVGLADGTLVKFTGKVTAVNSNDYVVSTTDGLTSIHVVPHSYDYKTDRTLLNQNVTVKGYLWSYTSTGKEVTYAYVLGNPASGKLEFENGDPYGASTSEAAPYHDDNASFLEGVDGWSTNGDAVEFVNVAAATEMTIGYAYASGTGAMNLYVNGSLAKTISFPATGASNTYGTVVVTGLSIPSGATLRFQRDNGQAAPKLDYAILGTTYAVSGTVTDASNGNAPVAGAKVFFSPVSGAIANYTYSAITNASGNYTLRLPAGTWYAAAGLSAEVMIKTSADQSFALSADKTGLNFSINWLPSRSGLIEAETGKLMNNAMASQDTAASGGMAVKELYNANAAVEFSNIAAVSQVTIAYDYSGGPFSVYVNGVHAGDLNLTSHSGTYAETTLALSIPDHASVRFQHDTGDHDTHIDYVIMGTAPTTYTITSSAGTGGSITPNGSTVVNRGASQSYTITPNTGYTLSQVTVDGVNQGAVSSYTFVGVTANHTISATFTATSNLVAYYQFENNVNDAQGTYNGTAYNTPTYVAGKVGSYAINFNGTNQYVTIPRPVQDNFSIAFWAKTTQTSPTGTQWYSGKGLVDGEVGGVQNDFGIGYLNSKVAFGVGNTDTTIQSTSLINTGNWVHVACTRDSATGQIKIYVNGTLETTGTGATGTKSAPATLHIGNLQTNLNYFAGSMDQLRIYNYVLSAAEVTALASEGVPQQSNLLFSCVTDSLPASGNAGNWASYLPAGQTFTAMNTPQAATLSGVKWEQNAYADGDGYDVGTYSSSIPCNGASIICVVKPTRSADTGNWRSIVDIFYNRLVLAITNDTGKICVRRQGLQDWAPTGTEIPDGQITVLSLVAQADGTYKVWANGTLIMTNNTVSALTSLVPNVPGPYANHINIGRNNPDGWSTYNGYIGDVYTYTVALTDAERQQLQTSLANKFGVSNMGLQSVGWSSPMSVDYSAPLIDLGTSKLPKGPLSNWSNLGSLAGEFVSAESAPVVEAVDGQWAVTFDGSQLMEASFVAPDAITGSKPFTTAIWAYDPIIDEGETLLSWSSNAGVSFGSSFSGAWHLVCQTYDGADLKTYMDGIMVSSEAKTLAALPSLPVVLGCGYTTTGDTCYLTGGFSGSIGMVKVYDRALSQTEITKLYDQSF